MRSATGRKWWAMLSITRASLQRNKETGISLQAASTTRHVYQAMIIKPCLTSHVYQAREAPLAMFIKRCLSSHV